MSTFTKARQKSAHNMIVRWGGGAKKGKLSRTGVTRPCTIARQEYKPTERGLYLDGSNRFVVSAFDLAVAPDHEQDVVLFNGRKYNIVQPPITISPDGVPVFWQLITMDSGPAT